MNRYTQLTATMALIAVLTLANTAVLSSYAYAPATESNSARGHFILVVHDEFGNIKDYQEIDNIVVDEGDACIANLAFGDATNVLAACANGKFDAVAVSDCDGLPTAGACEALTDTTTALDDADTDGAEIGDECDDEGTDPAEFSATWTAATRKATLTAKFTFTPLEVDASGTIKQAAIVNNCTMPGTNQMFAIQNFASPITLTGSDTLTINYEVTIGAAGS